MNQFYKSIFLFFGFFIFCSSFALAEKKVGNLDLEKISVKDFKIGAGEYEFYFIDGKKLSISEFHHKMVSAHLSKKPLPVFCAVQTHCDSSGAICGKNSERVVNRDLSLKGSVAKYDVDSFSGRETLELEFAKGENDFGIITCVSNEASKKITLVDLEQVFGSKIVFVEKAKAGATASPKNRVKNKNPKPSSVSKIKGPLSTGLSIIEFTMEGCKPCEEQKKVFAELRDRYKECILFEIFRSGVFEYYPTLSFYRGHVRLKTRYGYQSKEQIEEWIRATLTPKELLQCSLPEHSHKGFSSEKAEDHKMVKRVDLLKSRSEDGHRNSKTEQKSAH